MKIVRCKNIRNHFYDADRYAECPQCSKNSSGGAPSPAKVSGANMPQFNNQSGASLPSYNNNFINPSVKHDEYNSSDDNDATLFLDDSTMLLDDSYSRNTQPVRPNPVNTQPPRPNPVNTQPIRPKPVNTQPIRPKPVNTQPPRPMPVNTQSPRPMPVNTQPPRPMPVNTQPPRPMPVNTQSPRPMPVNTQPPRPMPVNTQPPRPMPVNTQPPRPMPVNTQSPRPMPASAQSSEMVKKKKGLLTGWLAVTNGDIKGASFELHVGNNLLGRGNNTDIDIPCDYEGIHAIISYNLESNVFIISPCGDKFIIRLNGQQLMRSALLDAYAVISVGSLDCVFVPLCGSKFTWKK